MPEHKGLVIESSFSDEVCTSRFIGWWVLFFIISFFFCIFFISLFDFAVIFDKTSDWISWQLGLGQRSLIQVSIILVPKDTSLPNKFFDVTAWISFHLLIVQVLWQVQAPCKCTYTYNTLNRIYYGKGLLCSDIFYLVLCASQSMTIDCYWRWRRDEYVSRKTNKMKQLHKHSF